jgi:hypothetical protein
MTQQEMEARIEKLEKQVLFLASLSTTVSMSVSAMAGELPTKEDMELSMVIMHNFSKAGLTKETVMELFK